MVQWQILIELKTWNKQREVNGVELMQCKSILKLSYKLLSTCLFCPNFVLLFILLLTNVLFIFILPNLSCYAKYSHRGFFLYMVPFVGVKIEIVYKFVDYLGDKDLYWTKVSTAVYCYKRLTISISYMCFISSFCPLKLLLSN